MQLKFKHPETFICKHISEVQKYNRYTVGEDLKGKEKGPLPRLHLCITISLTYR